MGLGSVSTPPGQTYHRVSDDADDVALVEIYFLVQNVIFGTVVTAVCVARVRITVRYLALVGGV